MSKQKMVVSTTIPKYLFELTAENQVDIVGIVQYCITLGSGTKLEDLQAIARDLQERGISSLKFTGASKETLLTTIMQESLCNYHKHNISDLSLAPVLENQSMKNLQGVAHFLYNWAERCRDDMRNDNLIDSFGIQPARDVPTLVQQILNWLLQLTLQYYSAKPLTENKLQVKLQRGLLPQSPEDDKKKAEPKRKKRKVNGEEIEIDEQTPATPIRLQQFSPPTQIPTTPQPNHQQTPSTPVQQPANVPQIQQPAALLLTLDQEEKSAVDAFLADMFKAQEQRSEKYCSANVTLQEIQQLERSYTQYLKNKKVEHCTRLNDIYMKKMTLLQQMMNETQAKRETALRFINQNK
jgi:hypothetical protein